MLEVRGDRESKTILLFGMPRSGTTWLGKIFDSHPDVLYRHEPDSEMLLSNVPLFVSENKKNRYNNLLNRYISDIPNSCSLRTCGKLPFFPKSYLNSFELLALKISLYAARISPRLFFEKPICRMFQNISNRDYVFAWKSIESFGRINALLEANSNAKVIYIIRNPCGQIASVINGERRGNFLAANRSSEDYDYFSLLADSEEGKRIELDMTKVREIDPIERMALRWMLCNEKAIADIGRYRNRGLIVKYEDLCVDPLKKAKEMFDFVGLEWNVQTEEFIQRSISMSSASYYSVFKNPIESMNRWKSQLAEEEVNAISSIVGNSEAAKTIYLDT